MYPQSESPFFSRLPGELRNQIYDLCLIASSPIVDPSIPPSNTIYAKSMNIRSFHHRMPEMGVPLLRTCKRIFREVSPLALYSQNTFRFTSSFCAQRFLTALPKERRALIQDVEVDLREVNEMQPSIEREWVQYLSWAPELDSIWARKLGGLRIAAPAIKTLRFNIEGWRFSGTLRSVSLLQDLFRGLEGLDRITLTGTDGSDLLFGSKDRYLAQWGPVVFVGIMRFAKLAGMVDWMAGCVIGDRENKFVRWSKVSHTVGLEILSLDTFQREAGARGRTIIASPTQDLVDGCCSLIEYEQRLHSGEWPNNSKL